MGYPQPWLLKEANLLYTVDWTIIAISNGKTTSSLDYNGPLTIEVLFHSQRNVYGDKIRRDSHGRSHAKHD